MKKPIRVYEVDLTGTRLADMEAEARKQFDMAFAEQKWELTGVYAELRMVSVGFADDEWLPGPWSALYKAAAR